MPNETLTSETYAIESNSLPDYYQKLLQELEETGETLCNQLKERMITLKTSIDSLKENVQNEKKAWKKEVQETAKVEKELQKHKWKDYLPSGDYNQQLDMLTNAVLKSQIITQSQKRKEMEMDNFKQKLLEAENLCNVEMLKIRQSLENLKPLQAMADEWETQSSQSEKEDLKILKKASTNESKNEILILDEKATEIWNSNCSERETGNFLSEKDSGISCDEK